MRPPEFTGGNARRGYKYDRRACASMRPPEFTGGNDRHRDYLRLRVRSLHHRFNEAAGIHRRKPRRTAPGTRCSLGCFNEAAGIHRRKPLRGVVGISLIPRCFNEAAGIHRRKRIPDCSPNSGPTRFNEAAGIHRRKRSARASPTSSQCHASMRPPEFTGGNCHPTPST